jgi:hypothetical protein
MHAAITIQQLHVSWRAVKLLGYMRKCPVIQECRLRLQTRCCQSNDLQPEYYHTKTILIAGYSRGNSPSCSSSWCLIARAVLLTPSPSPYISLLLHCFLYLVPRFVFLLFNLIFVRSWCHYIFMSFRFPLLNLLAWFSSQLLLFSSLFRCHDWAKT